MKRLLAITMLLISQTVFAQDKEHDIEKFFTNYVELLKKADYPEALNCWGLLDRTISDQLKLQYANEPIKLEMESPLWRNIEAIRAGTATVEVDTIRFSRDFAQIYYAVKTDGKSYVGRSYAISESVLNPSFVSAVHVYCEAWEETSSRFIRLKYRDPSLFQTTALEDADVFVEETAKKLGISNEKMMILETLKFNAFLCESYGEVEQIAGKLALGAMMPSMDAVISKYMPPYHEISQFLVNYSLKDAPSHTLPILKYGTATFLGGRWGRSPEVLHSLGSYLYLNDLSPIDTLIPPAWFETFEANPDFAYPIAGLFCEFVWNKIGRTKYFELYRQMSGTRAQVEAITVDQFKQAVATALGSDWAAIEAEFKEGIKQTKYSGIAPGSQDQGNLVLESGTSALQVRVVEDSTHYNFVVKLAQNDAQGALLLANMGPSPYKSFLFGEQFTDSTYFNQVYGIRFSAAEAGTYNYYTNEITGKYIVGVTSDQPLADKSGSTLRFRVEKKLLDGFDKMVSRVVDTE
ncbi:MAG: hypothetical protein WBP42_01135 [Candidatus Zixiibacteriota bacterium]